MKPLAEKMAPAESSAPAGGALDGFCGWTLGSSGSIVSPAREMTSLRSPDVGQRDFPRCPSCLSPPLSPPSLSLSLSLSGFGARGFNAADLRRLRLMTRGSLARSDLKSPSSSPAPRSISPGAFRGSRCDARREGGHLCGALRHKVQASPATRRGDNARVGASGSRVVEAGSILQCLRHARSWPTEACAPRAPQKIRPCSRQASLKQTLEYFRRDSVV